MANDKEFEIRRTLQNLLPGQRYAVRVRALNNFGIYSDWSEALDFTPGGAVASEDSTIKEEIFFSMPGTLEEIESGRAYLKEDYHLKEVLMSLATVGSTTTTVTGYKNGAAFMTITLTSGSFMNKVTGLDLLFSADSNFLQFDVTGAGTGAKDLVIQARFG